MPSLISLAPCFWCHGKAGSLFLFISNTPTHFQMHLMFAKTDLKVTRSKNNAPQINGNVFFQIVGQAKYCLTCNGSQELKNWQTTPQRGATLANSASEKGRTEVHDTCHKQQCLKLCESVLESKRMGTCTKSGDLFRNSYVIRDSSMYIHSESR